MPSNSLTRAGAYPLIGLGLGIALFVAGCNNNDNNSLAITPKADLTGAVYAMTNAAEGNQVVVFSQAPDGSLTEVQTADAGAAGPGPSKQFDHAPIDTQNEMVLSPGNRFLFVVDAGDNKISSFKIRNPDEVNDKGKTFNGSLTLVDTVSSGGQFPVSLTVHDNLLYVVNAKGDGGNISGFTFDKQGKLKPIKNSTRPLSGTKTPMPGNAVGPGVIAFSPDGKSLVVTEKVTSLIDVYSISGDVPSQPNVQPSDGRTPFGADFDGNGNLIVSNTNVVAPRKPAPNESSSLTSYSLASDGALKTVTSQVKTMFLAACWVRLSPDQLYVYTTNTGSKNITGFTVADDGSLERLNPDGFTAGASVGLDDLVFAGSYLYVSSASGGVILGYKMSKDGSLSSQPIIQAGNLPSATAEGIAAFQF